MSEGDYVFSKVDGALARLASDHNTHCRGCGRFWRDCGCDTEDVYWLDGSVLKACKYYVNHNRTRHCDCRGCGDIRARLATPTDSDDESQ